jgi:transcription antitermination protein NusB
MSKSSKRNAARLAAAQALYQYHMEPLPLPQLLHEFHAHRLGATLEGDTYIRAEEALFDSLVKGTIENIEKIDAEIETHLSQDWAAHRIDKLLRQIVRLGCYELRMGAATPIGSVINAWLDVTDAFFQKPEKNFVNAVLDKIAKAHGTEQ